MRSLLVCILWLLAGVIGFVFGVSFWMVFVTSPRLCWHAYKKHDLYDETDWEQPWFPMSWLTSQVRKLDPGSNKSVNLQGGMNE